MTFNVENLFDNIDDPVKDDKAYLPLSAKQTAAHKSACNEIEVQRWRDECLNLDWNDDILDYKMTVIAATILQVNDGRGADIIALQEIENLAVLEQLRTGYLANAGYLPAILIEGTDARGIDVAFLSRLPLASRRGCIRSNYPTFRSANAIPAACCRLISSCLTGRYSPASACISRHRSIQQACASPLIDI